jgi:hypothetical protein
LDYDSIVAEFALFRTQKLTTVHLSESLRIVSHFDVLHVPDAWMEESIHAALHYAKNKMPGLAAGHHR